MSGRIKTVGILGVLLVLVSLRFVNLENDPPLYFVGHGQDQLTDPYHLTFHARNQVLYDQWNPFSYHRWDIFKHSIVSVVAYGAFSLATPSRMVANAAALVLQLGGMALFLFGWRRLRGDREALIAAGLLLINSTLFFYGRLPFLENGLIFFCGLMFFVFVRYHDKLWGAALAGALVALASLAGKLFGALLMAPLLVTLFYQHRQLALKPVLCALGGFAGAGAVFILIVNGGQVAALMSYYAEQTVGMYGAPPGLSSIGNFFAMFATFGGESGLAEYTPALILLSLISLILILVTTPEVFKFKSEFVPLVFAASWLIVGALGLMPFQHRPMRYSLFLYLPMSALGAYALNLAWRTKVRFRIHLPWIALPLIWFTLLYIGTQVAISFAEFGDRFNAGAGAVIPAGIIATGITALLYLWLKPTRSIPARKTVFALLAVTAAVSVGLQSSRIARGLASSGKYLQTYNREISQLISPESVLTGPYTPALTIGNNLRGVIYMFGLSNIERELFNRFPITHVVTDRSNWKRAVADFPHLRSARILAEMAVREQVIALYRVPGAAAPQTDFEIGAELFDLGQYDSALIHFNLFSGEYPDNLFGQLRIVLTQATLGNLPAAKARLDSLAAVQPENYMLHAFCDGFYRKVYGVTGVEGYLTLAAHHKRKAQEINPKVALAP